MSLPDSPTSPAPRWAPTHVQVTVLQARGLRSKAKGGGGGSGSDAYAVMALGKEKFATSVAERCLGSPVWREEATFELPSLPRRGLGGPAGPGPNAVLQLSVLHRALLGLDKFLGRAEISLGELQSEGGRRSTRWYKLHSKPGKKEKERGEIEVDIQFMRSNMTASMFDLSMKDKPRTPFSKLKNKLKGKRGNGLPDTASAIIPSITHSPADSEEESNDKEKKKSKFKTLFSKPGLHKSNISQSMSVLPTLQPVSERVRLRPSDFQSQWSDGEDDDTLTTVSENPSTNRANNNVLGPPSVMMHKRTGSGDSKQLNQIIAGSAKKDMHSLFGLRSKNDPVSRSNLCINGSHVYMEENESKNDLVSKEGTTSPQTSQRKRLFLSQENLSFEHDKELENPAGLALDKLPSGSSSLESFKAMTLPSYKLLAGGDSVENNTPFVSDTPKETKEIKKQENKKSGLLSLVTGKKEAKTSEENTESSLKAKEVKRNEKELARKETNPFELPVDGKRGHGAPKSNATDIVIAKTSVNPFSENIAEGEKPEKNAASVKPSQTKPVKPRLGVSSEDETKATSFPPVPLPPICYPSNNENNPFTSKFDEEQKTQEVGRFDSSKNVSVNNPFSTKWMQDSGDLECSAVSTCLPSTSGHENNPFSPKWGQESHTQEMETSSLYSLHSAASTTETHTIPSQLSNVNDPFVIKVGQESERIKSPPTSIGSVSLTENIDNSKYRDDVSSEKFQDENLTNQTNTVSNFSGSLSESLPPQFSDLVRVNQKPSYDKVHIVLPFKEKNGMKKSVAFALDESKEDEINSHNDSADEDSFEINVNKEALNSFEKNSGQVIELNIEKSCGSKPDEEDIISVHTSGNLLKKEVESGLSKKNPLLPVARVLNPLQTKMSVPELSDKIHTVPPKPAPRNILKVKKGVPLTDEPKGEDVSSHASVLKEVSSDSSTISEKPSHICSLTSEMAVLPHIYDNGNTGSSQSIKDDSNHMMRTSLGISGPGELNVKPITLPVIPEVASDDEQLGDYQRDPENITLSEDLSRNEDGFMNLWASAERTDLTSTKKAIGETVSGLMQMSNFGNSSNRLLKDPTNNVHKNPNHNLTGIEKECGEHSNKDRQDDCPESSAKPVSLYPLSNSSQSCSVSSFQSDSHGFNKAESPKKATTEELDAKVESSGRKKLLQAWVSPSETHPNPGGNSAKLRLHPVKPMNASTNQPSAKTLSISTKMLDNQTEFNLKKYDRSDPAYAYAQLTHDELIQLVLKQKDILAKRDVQVRELEDYIDNLLVRVMEATPNILRIEVHPKKKAGKM
ncbi:rab11 family-interacting protein 1 isoform X1 [Thamnophis elegans]|uniref:rab11 family-interacting protein 1 isoform X1 n=2 Tax=Thamnophis elegans TaxID=35005 RepID=UPI0013787602|nr:rab11 family-interacting protein 1 isoform X1 [Thamnophis elegans]